MIDFVANAGNAVDDLPGARRSSPLRKGGRFIGRFTRRWEDSVGPSRLW